jgi:tetratricopeptide (TPR) repeat protein
MGGWWGALWLSLGLLAMLGPDSARAQAAETAANMSEARALFMAGRVAFDEGRYEAAVKHFEASYEQSKRPALLYNIGQCYDRMRRDEEAISAFERYLAVETDPEMRASVETRMIALRAAVASRKPAPAAQAGAGSALRTEPPPLALDSSPARFDVVPPLRSEPRRWWLGAPALTAGGGVMLGLTGGLLMVLGNVHGHDVEHAEVGRSYKGLQSDLDGAERQWVAGQVLLGVGAAAVAGGLVWLLLDRRERAGVQVSMTPTSLRLRSHF